MQAMTADQIRERISARSWYHCIEVAPGIKTPGRYDPSEVIETMGFPADLAGKTVLDVGSYDGYFAFEAERRGASYVLATDRHPADHCGFALAREILGSRVDYRVASVYDLDPVTFGTFDVVLFPGVFYHLRHPLLALDRIHSVCRESMFLETHVLDRAFVHEGQRLALDEMHPALADAAVLQFYPHDELNEDASNWFAPSVRAVETMLATSGFRPRRTGRWGDRAAFVAERLPFVQPFWY